MKFLYVFLCLICLLNYTTLNQLDRVENLQVSLIKVKSSNLNPNDFPNGDDGENEQNEKDNNGPSSSAPSLIDSDDEDTNGSSPFGGIPPRPPTPLGSGSRKGKLRRKHRK
ncbi:Uncharacterized protein CTYZ_00002280 [Cryptosporidium tyzzeri]|nr:Uncharacterized protein CTYZ_00002280 [Cryptosporidium tyzzeri]